MNTIPEFKDFNITADNDKKRFKGDKIKPARLLNREIIIEDYEIKPSIKQPGTDCLHLQIRIGDTQYVSFTGAVLLMEFIKKVPKLPFRTTIIEENDFYKFT
jgi:hypothetical protein